MTIAGFIRRARRNRHRPLPIASCPAVPMCLALHCRWNLLADLTSAGGIAIAGYGTLAPLRTKRGTTRDADVEAAADAVVARARRLGDTCALRWAARGPLTQSEVAAALETTHQRIDQIEHEACAVVASALLSIDDDITSNQTPPAWRWRAEAA